MDVSDVDVLVVGSGLSGSLAARILAEEYGLAALVVERRSHVGGNVHDRLDGTIRYHVYGPHVFHTGRQDLWTLLNRFVRMQPYRLRARAMGRGMALLAGIP